MHASLPLYSGMTIIETSIDPTQVGCQTASIVGKGSYIALGSRRALMAQRNSDGSIRVYIALTVSESWANTSGLELVDVGVTKEKILDDYFEDWSPNIKSLVVESGLHEMRLWPLYDTPKPSEGGRWLNNVGITLIGDAAHVMPPWTGRGANMAMLDGLVLGKQIGQALQLSSRSSIRVYTGIVLAACMYPTSSGMLILASVRCTSG